MVVVDAPNLRADDIRPYWAAGQVLQRADLPDATGPFTAARACSSGGGWVARTFIVIDAAALGKAAGESPVGTCWRRPAWQHVSAIRGGVGTRLFMCTAYQRPLLAVCYMHGKAAPLTCVLSGP